MGLLSLQFLTAYLIVSSAWPASGQPNFVTVAKRTVVYLAIAAVCLNIGLTLRIAGVTAILALAHAAIDTIETGHSRWRYDAAGSTRPSVAWFLSLQALHAIAILMAVFFLQHDRREHAQTVALELLRRRDLYAIAAGYLTVVFAGGRLVQKITESFLTKIDENVKTLKPGLPEAGKYIGWVERSLVLTFVLAGFADAIGFLLGVKALTRFPEISEDKKGHFGEYFLVGTLTSVGLALLGGLALKATLALLRN